MSDDAEAHSHQNIQHNGETYIKLSDAAATFRHLRSEITRLRAALATARRDALAEIKQDTDELIEQGRQDGMEEAAQDLEGRAKMLRSWDPDSVGAHWALHYAAAIRAAAGEGK